MKISVRKLYSENQVFPNVGFALNHSECVYEMYGN